ncbi:glycine-rich domain-containing protein [Pseudomonas guariconensis]|uniref:glycine-rich domain-containing protein n=1 Tax=Pseudomonas guariconensis TaxID=1288410 RepID=UPI0039C8A949
MTNALALKAPLASPIFTGDPRAPTPAVTDNDTSLATTAFVKAVLAQYGVGQALEPTETDLDKYTTPGNFITPQGGVTNLPAGWSPSTRYSLVVAGYGASRYLVQTLTTGLAQGVSIVQAQRTMSAAGVWSPWHSVWNSNNTPRQADPLDLTAAALLNPGSFGVGAAIVTTEVDMNNFQIPGNYLTAASGLLNMPPGWNVSQRHSIVVDGLGPSGHLVQTLTAGLAGGDPKQAIRTFTSGKTWTDWEEVATSRNSPFRGTQVYKTAGVFNWAVPAGVKKVWVTVIGGGGGGGASNTSGVGSGGGGGGGISQRLVDLAGVSTVTVTVGGGGLGSSVAGTVGETGGTSSFGAYASATGGLGGGGNNLNGNAPGNGGLGSGGDFNSTLGPGQPNYGNFGGSGGGPGSRSTQAPVAGQAGLGPGGGGSGSYFGYSGGAGAAGNVIIQW